MLHLRLGFYATDHRVKDTTTQTTYQTYERIINVHLAPTLGRIKLKNLSPTHVRGLYREKLYFDLSTASVQHIHTLLHKALKQAMNDELVPRNVTEAAVASRQIRKEIQALPPNQARAFLQAAKSDRLEAL